MRKQPSLGGIQRNPCSRPGKAGYTRGGLLLLTIVAAGVTVYVSGRISGDTRDNAVRERYLAAVYVLQSMGGPASEESVPIPRGVVLADNTESLLHHADKSFVLRVLAGEFASLGLLREQFPEAPLFEAYTRLALGEHRAAAELLTAYVVDRPYRERHYSLLCKILKDLEDYSSLLIISKEWQEREPVCLPERLRDLWYALFGLGRFADARDAMFQQGSCLSRERFVYAARASQAMGRVDEVKSLMCRALEGRRDEGNKMLRLWGQLQGLETPRQPNHMQRQAGQIRESP